MPPTVAEGEGHTGKALAAKHRRRTGMTPTAG